MHPVQLLKSPPAGVLARQKAEFNGNMTQSDEDSKQTDNVLHQYLGVTLEVECAAANAALVLLFYLFIFLSAPMWAFAGKVRLQRALALRCRSTGAPH